MAHMKMLILRSGDEVHIGHAEPSNVTLKAIHLCQTAGYGTPQQATMHRDRVLCTYIGVGDVIIMVFDVDTRRNYVV